jgi:hypothetical protein
MSPAVKNVLLLVALLAILGATGFLFTRGNKESLLPDDPKQASQWMCDTCKEHVSLTPAKFDEWSKSADKVRRDPNYPGRPIVFLCPKCSKFTVVRADVEEDGTWTIAVDSKGKPVSNPQK